MINKMDLRVSKSTRSMQEALLRLLAKKELHKIQIKELTEEANVSRQTFYLHYQNKEELYESCVKVFFDDVNHKIESCLREYPDKAKNRLLIYIIDIFKSELEELKLLISVANKDLITDSMKVPTALIMETLGMTSIIRERSEVQQELFIEYMTGGMYRVMRYLVKNERQMTTEEMTDEMMFLFSLHFQGLETLEMK